MNIRHMILSGGLLLSLTGCRINNQEEESLIRPRSDVTVTRAVIKNTGITEEFQGITRYIQTIEIRAHVTGIVSKVNVSLAEKVTARQPLFEIRPRETLLLESANLHSEFARSSADTVFAFSSGIVNRIDVQPGDFVQEGDLLAGCVEKQSLRVVVSVPLEMDLNKIENRACSVLFPDGKILSGFIGKGLPSANETNQTSEMLVKLNGDYLVAENIHVKVLVKTGDVINGIFLPVSAIYGNEEQNRFWAIKIQNDSIAVRMRVQKGVRLDTLQQIISNEIDITDRFICSGGYALADSALVHIIKSDQ